MNGEWRVGRARLGRPEDKAGRDHRHRHGLTHRHSLCTDTDTVSHTDTVCTSTDTVSHTDTVCTGTDTV
jgi:hypothetical protein